MGVHVPEIECPACDGWGVHPALSTICTACNGDGWRPMNDGEIEAAAERQAEEAQFRSDMTLDEQHLRAWEQKQGLRR